MHLTLYNFIFQIKKKIGKILIFWNTLSPTLTTNTGLAINTLTTNKACLLNNKLKRPSVGPSNLGIMIENTTLKLSTKKIKLKNDPLKFQKNYKPIQGGLLGRVRGGQRPPQQGPAGSQGLPSPQQEREGGGHPNLLV